MLGRIRNAKPLDASACIEIYTPYVQETAITFELEPPSTEEMKRRIATAHEWLVLEEDGRVLGYACASEFHNRPAYRWACEVSIYLEPGLRRTGSGRALYDELFSRLAERRYRVAVAGMTLPNEASLGLHQAMGFQPVGVYHNIGFKLGIWHDVAWMQRPLDVGVDPPVEPSHSRS